MSPLYLSFYLPSSEWYNTRRLIISRSKHYVLSIYFTPISFIISIPDWYNTRRLIISRSKHYILSIYFTTISFIISIPDWYNTRRLSIFRSDHHSVSFYYSILSSTHPNTPHITLMDHVLSYLEFFKDGSTRLN